MNSSTKDILSVFKGVLVDTNSNSNQDSLSINDVQLNLLKHGIVFDECVYGHYTTVELNNLAQEAIDLYGFNAQKMNSTFWKRFSDVESRSEGKLHLHQLIHYISTYGRGIVGQETDSLAYEPEYLKSIDVDIKHELVYIAAYTHAEIQQKIKNMLTSGMALKQDTIDALFRIIKENKYQIDYVDEISNREFMCVLCKELGLVPKNFDEFARYLNYLVTKNTMLVLKSRDTYNAMRDAFAWSLHNPDIVNQSIIKYAETYGIKPMAANIRRYHDLFVLLHSKLRDRQAKKILNRAFKLSKRSYLRNRRRKPILDDVLNKSISLNQIKDAASRATIYKLFKVINAMSMKDTTSKLYRIRNGKSYFDINDRANKIKDIMLKEIKSRLGDWSNKVFYIPEGINYVMPTSEKTFVGVLPYLSSYELIGRNAVAGVAWTKECDLDLHARFVDGESIGFNSSFNHGGITFSGDMTHTNRYHYAAEFIKIDQSRFETPALVNINNFDGGENADIDVFVGATGDLDTSSYQGVATQLGEKSFMFKDKMDAGNKNLMLVCPTEKGFKTILVNFDLGNVRVPRADNISEQLTELLIKQADTAFTLNNLIELLGGKVITDPADFELAQKHKSKVSAQFIDTSSKMKDYVELTPTGKFKVKMKTIQENDTEFIDMTPAKITTPSFTDLLVEPQKKEDKAWA